MEKRWMTGEEILERWQGLDFELVEAFKDGCLVEGERMTLVPINMATGERMLDICLACEHGTFEGMPGSYCFENSRPNACGAGPDYDCCDDFVSDRVLAERLKQQNFMMKEVQEFEGFKFELTGKIPGDSQEFSQSLPIEDAKNDLSPREKQELGRLRVEKEKWDLSLQATMWIALALKEGRRVTKEDLWKVLEEQGLMRSELPDTTFAKIWGVIPKEFKSLGGRPKKMAQ